REVDIPENADVTVLGPASVPIVENVEEALEEALDHPTGGPPFVDLIRSLAPRTVAIAVPDETRPTPVQTILPLVLKRLYGAALELECAEVTVLVGGGLHPPMDSANLADFIPNAVAPGCR